MNKRKKKLFLGVLVLLLATMTLPVELTNQLNWLVVGTAVAYTIAAAFFGVAVYNGTNWSSNYEVALAYVSVIFITSLGAFLLPNLYMDFNIQLRWNLWQEVAICVWMLSMIAGLATVLIWEKPEKPWKQVTWILLIILCLTFIMSVLSV